MQRCKEECKKGAKRVGEKCSQGAQKDAKRCKQVLKGEIMKNKREKVFKKKVSKQIVNHVKKA